MNHAPQEMQSAPHRSNAIYMKIATVLGLVVSFLAGFHLWSHRPGQVVNRSYFLSQDGSKWLFQTFARQGTGLQRADDIAFFADGSRLAMTCPRYTKFTLWQTAVNQAPVLMKTIDLPGRPQRVVPFQDKIIIIQRPPGDDRHIKPGFFEVYDSGGNKIAGPVEIGWDPDDMALAQRDGKLYALVLLSGNAEGEDNRPNPSVRVVELEAKSFAIKASFDIEIPEAKKRNQDPLRIVSGTVPNAEKKLEHVAMVTLGRNGAVQRLNWSDPAQPQWSESWSIDDGEPLGATLDNTGLSLLVAHSKTGALLSWPLGAGQAGTVPAGGNAFRWTAVQSIAGNSFPCDLATIAENQSAFGLIGQQGGGIYKLHGPFGFGSVRLMNLALHQPDSNTICIAICDRTGGIHWMTLKK